jgi:precorrin-6B methylase 2
MTRHRILDRLKSLLLPVGARPRSIRFGPAKGIRMELDLQHRSQTWLGLNERELAEVLLGSSRHVRTALDVGASEGSYTLFLLLRTPANRVVAFEPDDAARSLLERNLRLNGLAGSERIRVVPQAVGDGHDTVALDTLLPEIEMPCFVKIDVEGGEADVLRGSVELLKRGDVRVIVEVHSAALERECISLMKEAGLAVDVVENAWWRRLLPEQRNEAVNRWLVAGRGPVSP